MTVQSPRGSRCLLCLYGSSRRAGSVPALDAFHCLGECITRAHRGAFKDLSRESALSVLTPHGQSFPSRGVLLRDGSPESTTADCTSSNTVLWGMEAQLCVNGVDGQDAETGLFTPVLQHPSSIHRHKGGEAIIPRIFAA